MQYIVGATKAPTHLRSRPHSFAGRNYGMGEAAGAAYLRAGEVPDILYKKIGRAVGTPGNTS